MEQDWTNWETLDPKKKKDICDTKGETFVAEAIKNDLFMYNFYKTYAERNVDILMICIRKWANRCGHLISLFYKNCLQNYIRDPDKTTRDFYRVTRLYIAMCKPSPVAFSEYKELSFTFDLPDPSMNFSLMLYEAYPDVYAAVSDNVMVLKTFKNKLSMYPYCLASRSRKCISYLRTMAEPNNADLYYCSDPSLF